MTGYYTGCASLALGLFIGIVIGRAIFAAIW